MKVRRRPETIFRVGLLDRQSEVRFCIRFLVALLIQMVRYDSADGKYNGSFLFWFHGCSNLTQTYFSLTLSPKVYDGDSYLTSLGRMVAA
jgi:hypothetical protein